MRTPTVHPPPDSSVAGFTVIEVLVAILLVAVLASTVTMATAGSARVHQATALKQQATDAAEAVYERLRSDDGWEKTCPPLPTTSSGSAVRIGGTCSGVSRVRGAVMASSVMHNSDLDTTFQMPTLEARAVDDPSDGLGSADTDGKLPDYYQVKITIALSAADQARLGHFSPISLTSTLDPSSSASNQGSLVVSFCKAINQIDERITTAGCDAGQTQLKMVGCPAGSDCTPWDAVFGHSAGDPAGSDYVVEKSTLPGCTISGPVSRTCSSHWPNTGTPTGYLFTGLPAGMYTVHFRAPGGYKDWTTHYVPAATSSGTLRVAVDANERSRALATFQPSGHGQMTFEFWHRDTNAHYTGFVEGPVVLTPKPQYPYCDGGEYSHGFPTSNGISCSYEGNVGHTVENMTNMTFRVHYESWDWFVVQTRITGIKYSSTATSGQFTGPADDASFTKVAPAPVGRVTVPAKNNMPRAKTSFHRHSAWGNQGGWKGSLAAEVGPSTQILPLGLNSAPQGSINQAGTIEQSPIDPHRCSYIWVNTSGTPLCNGHTNVSTVKFVGRGDCYATMTGTPWNYSLHHLADGPNCQQHCMYYPPNSKNCCGSGSVVYKIETRKIMYSHWTSLFEDKTAGCINSSPTSPACGPPGETSSGTDPPITTSWVTEDAPTVTHPTPTGMSDCGPNPPVTITWTDEPPHSGPPQGGGNVSQGANEGTAVVVVN